MVWKFNAHYTPHLPINHTAIKAHLFYIKAIAPKFIFTFNRYPLRQCNNLTFF